MQPLLQGPGTPMLKLQLVHTHVGVCQKAVVNWSSLFVPPPLPPKHSTPPHYCITHFICNSAVKIDLFLHATTCSLCAVMLPIYWGYRNNNINGSKYEILIVWYSHMQSALFFISKKLMQHNEFSIHTVFYIVLHR